MSFTFRPATRENVALILGLAGPSGGGKTMSAMRLAKGMTPPGKRFCVLDTEAGRAKHYADLFDFDHGDLTAPFRPERYAEAIAAADEAGYPVIVVDSGSHEYAGEGGLLDWQEEEFQRLGAREAVKMTSWIKPKMAHKKMVTRLLQIRAHLILCFRAEQKVDMVKGNDGKIQVVPKTTLSGFSEWIPVAEKSLLYEFTASFLLTPDAPGRPKPIKLPEQVRAFFPLDQPITEETGAKLAAWARGGAMPSTTAPGNRAPASTPAEPRAQDAPPVDGRVKEQLLHDIVQELSAAHPGRAREDQEAKARLLAIGFGTRQWAKVQPLPSDTLRAGLEKIRAALRQTAIPKPAPLNPPPVEDPIGPGTMTDEQEIHAVMDRWVPPIDGEKRKALFRALFGTDNIEKVDFAACQDAIELFKKVEKRDTEAVAEVNRLLRRAA